jgi:hypothetical protein
MIYFLGTSVTVGWIIAGALFLAAAVWMVVMYREFKNAMVLPQKVSSDDEGSASFASDAMSDVGVKTSRLGPMIANDDRARRGRSRARSARALPRTRLIGR